MNTITKISDKNYSITKELIDAMLIDNNSELAELLVGLFTIPDGSIATTFIIAGAVIDGTVISDGFAIHEGVLTRIVGGEYTGFFTLSEIPTIIQGIDDFNLAYKTEINNRSLMPSQIGIAYADMVRLELAMKERYRSLYDITASINVRYAISTQKCFNTQFGRRNLALDLVKNPAQGSYPFPSGWNSLSAVPVGLASDSVQVSTALVTYGTTTVQLPVKLEDQGLYIYYPSSFTADDILIIIRMEYDLE